MRILFLTDNFPPESNAPAVRTYQHAHHWVRAGHAVTVLTCAPNFPEGAVYPGYRNRWRHVEWIDGIEVIRVKTLITANEGFFLRSLDYISFMFAAGLAGLLVRRPDIVIATSPQFFCAWGGWFVAACRRRPFVFELRDLWPASIVAVGAMRRGILIRCLEAIERSLYRRASAIVIVSGAFRAHLSACGVSPERVAVVSNGIDSDLFSPRAKDSALLSQLNLKDKFVVGYVGTLGLAHALNNLLDAAEQLVERSDIVFLIIGGGAQQASLIRELERRELKNVLLLGRQPRNEIPRYLSLCDLSLVHLKDVAVFETVIPSKIFEAIGMGLPILLCAPDGEAADLVRRHGVGQAILAEQPHALAGAVVGLCDNAAARSKLGEASRRASSLFDRSKQAEIMLDVLVAVANGRRLVDASEGEPR